MKDAYRPLRRQFLKTTGSAAAGLIAGAQLGSAAVAEAELHVQDAGPTINPHIYGHFIEHLGGVIYDGIWVGPDSKIPNINGIRKEFVDDMKRLGAPNIRWPGGCFADSYHWRDAIGPREKRPRTYNFWQPYMAEGVDATETNAFGTHEFLELCELTNSEPYLAANMRSGTPQEFHDWAMYCNAPLGTVSLADQRSANGRKRPWGVRYWGVGNETWGCGGNLAPDEYAILYNRFTTQFPRAYKEPFFAAVGPNAGQGDGRLDWTQGFFEALKRRPGASVVFPSFSVDGWAMHFYTHWRRTDSRGAGFSREEWYRVMVEGNRLESLIEAHWNLMGSYDRDHRIKLICDEWGVWHQPGSEIGKEQLFSQAGSLRDAVHAGMSLDIFNRHADKVHMANIAQTINCIHSLMLAQGDRYVRTPTFRVFEMYKPHMGARLVPLQVRTEDLKFDVGDSETGSLFGMAGSASVKDGKVTLTLTNPSVDADIDARVLVRGASVTEATGQVLTHDDFQAGNTFDAPDTVVPSDLAPSLVGNKLRVKIPARSVVALSLLAS